MSMPTEEQLVAAIEEVLAEAYEGKCHDYTWLIDRDGLFETIATLSARAATDAGTTMGGHEERAPEPAPRPCARPKTAPRSLAPEERPSLPA